MRTSILFQIIKNLPSTVIASKLKWKLFPFLFLSLLVLWILGTCIYAAIISYPVLSFMDQWEELTVQEYIKNFFAQHNEHRIAAGRVFFIVDTLLFQGRNIFNITSIFILQLIHTGFLLALFKKTLLKSESLWAWIAPLTFSLLFSLLQVSNMTWGFQVPFILVYASATASFYMLVFHSQKTIGFVTALFLAVVSSYSMFNGLLVFPLLVSLAFFIRLSAPKIITLILTAVAVFIFYFKDYSFLNHTITPSYLIENSWLFISYVLAYIGSPLGKTPALLIGFIGCGVTAAYLILALRKPKSFSPAQLALLHTLLFILAAAALAALGRMNLGLAQAFSSRYATPVLILWTITIGLALQQAEQFHLKNLTLGLKALVFILILATAAGQIKGLKKAIKTGKYRHEAAIALIAHNWDSPALGKIYPSVEILKQRVPVLEENHLSIFSNQ